jgi:GNAT superfamily N-acetyltransferase
MSARQAFLEHYLRYLGVPAASREREQTVFVCPRREDPICVHTFALAIGTFLRDGPVVSVAPRHAESLRERLAGRVPDDLEDLRLVLDDAFADALGLYWAKRMVRLTVGFEELVRPEALGRVRALREEDRDRWIRFQNLDRAPRFLQKAWAVKTREIRDGRHFVIAADGEIVSAAFVSDLHDGGGNIAVGTRPEHRRRGYGRAVVAAAASWCHERDTVPVYWADLANRPSIALAESLGFLRVAEEIAVTQRR